MLDDELLLRWLLPGLAVLALWYFGRSWSCNLRIRVRGGDVQVAGKVGAMQAQPIASFWREQLGEIRHAWVDGHWDGRRLQLRCSGSLSPGQRQRLRNFLVSIL